MREEHYDWVIIGSGFGGSVSAHRLTQKGYKVLVLEKGRRFNDEDFPKNNWDLKRWMWNPTLGLKGIFQMSFMKHMTVLHGVGVGGGSLVYANTLPTPKSPFFEEGPGLVSEIGRRSSRRTTRPPNGCSEPRRIHSRPRATGS